MLSIRECEFDFLPLRRCKGDGERLVEPREESDLVPWYADIWAIDRLAYLGRGRRRDMSEWILREEADVRLVRRPLDCDKRGLSLRRVRAAVCRARWLSL